MYLLLVIIAVSSAKFAVSKSLSGGKSEDELSTELGPE